MSGTHGVRATAANVIARVVEGSTLDAPLALAQAELPQRDRPLLAQLCFGTLRLAPRLQALLQQLVDKPLRDRDRDLQALLMLGLYQLSDSRVPDHAAVSETVDATRELGKPWARGLVNAVLRRYRREARVLESALPPAAAAAHPEWLYQALAQAWPEQLDAIITSNNSHPPMTLRVNRRIDTRDAWMSRLQSTGAEAHAGVLAPEAVYLAQATGVEQLPGFAEGAVSVQDEAAQLAAHWLGARPGDRILDACAAPGGKTCHLLEIEPNLAGVTAMDIDAQRLQRVRDNLDRLGFTADLVTADAVHATQALGGQQFDRVLVDAPCSATGVIRRHPDIKLLRRSRDIPGLAAQQAGILEGVWPCLRAGGRLLYVTCSVLPMENQAVVARFLADHGDALEIPLSGPGTACSQGRQVLPGAGGPDGLYFALLEKHSG